MKTLAILVCMTVAAAALAGCTQQPPPQQGGTATSVSVLEGYAEDAAPRSNVTVCWRVEGSGTVPHTAVHYDNATHPGNDVTFNAYAGAAYPDNATAAKPVQLPGNFCTRIPVGTSDVYFRAHVIDSRGGNGMVSAEHEIRVRGVVPPVTTPSGTVIAVTWQDFNGTAPANTNATVCWSVRGTGTIAHTAVHTDTASHPVANNFTAYAGTAYYPANRTTADPAGYNLTATGTGFCTAIPVPATGTLYLRAHAMVSGQQAPGMLSVDERTLRAA